MHKYQLKSVALMHDKSEKAVQYATSGSLLKARESIDELRFLRAVFAMAKGIETNTTDQGDEQKEISKNLTAQLEALNNNLATISNWLDATQKAFPKEELVQSAEGVNIYLDSQIPLVWNWLEDVVIIQTGTDENFISALKTRGQRKIIVLSAGESTKDTLYIETPNDALPMLKGWIDDPVGRQIFIAPERASERDKALLNEIKEIYLCFVIRDNTKRKFSRRWALQQIANLPQIIRNKNIKDLTTVFSGKKCIIISPGPSLKKNIKLLKDNESEHIVIAVAQACPALLKHNIHPDFVMVIDPIDYSHVLDGTDCSKIPGLIIGDICHPAFYKKPFQNIFTFFALSPALNSADIVKAEPMPLFGGSVSIAAVDLAMKLGAKEISLIGSDLSFADEIYYGYEPSTEGEATKTSELTFPTFIIPGYFGDEVITKPEFLTFLKEFEELAATTGDDQTLNNCTEGGAYIEGFNHIPLAEVLAKEPRKKNLRQFPNNTPREISDNLKSLLKSLSEERNKLNKAKILTKECLQLAEKLRSPDDKKLATLNKKEKQLVLLTNSTESLDLFCNTEIEAVQRQIGRINSFEGNIKLSKNMYQMIFNAIEVLRVALSEQITVMKDLR